MFKTLKSIKSQNHSSDALISVCVRLKNEVKFINSFWESLKKQTIFDSIEIVFIDSGSTDGTLEFLKKKNCNIYSIDPWEFSFGETCNLAMELTKCNIVYLFSGHVIIEQMNALEETSKFLAMNENSSGYFRQIPNYNTGCSIYDKTFLKFRFPTIKADNPTGINFDKHSFSNAASAINRKNWTLTKFKNIVASEDYFWANDVIKLGGKIFYFHAQNVLHSHNEPYDTIYKRVLINAKARFPEGVGLIKPIFIFGKVFFAILINSGNFLASFRYANAHTRGYLSIKNE